MYAIFVKAVYRQNWVRMNKATKTPEPEYVLAALRDQYAVSLQCNPDRFAVKQVREATGEVVNFIKSAAAENSDGKLRD